MSRRRVFSRQTNPPYGQRPFGMPTLFRSPVAMNVAAVRASYEAWAESIKPPPGHIPEINGIDSP